MNVVYGSALNSYKTQEKLFKKYVKFLKRKYL